VNVGEREADWHGFVDPASSIRDEIRHNRTVSLDGAAGEFYQWLEWPMPGPSSAADI
jgi:hypothetical protein